MFNIKKTIETKVEEVKTDIKDNVEYSMTIATGAILVSYIIGYMFGSRGRNTNSVNVTIVERERELINNIIVNK